MTPCCDNPIPAQSAPNPQTGIVTAYCGHCGHNHGDMSLKDSEELFKQLRRQARGGSA